MLLINSVAVFSYVTTGLFSYQVSFLVSLIVLIPSILDLIGVKLFSYLSVIKLISFFIIGSFIRCCNVWWSINIDDNCYNGYCLCIRRGIWN